MISLNREVGAVFNKKYVWPGFHWFTLDNHVKALTANGFHVEKAICLNAHYAKTAMAWYERMMAEKERFIDIVGERTFRAWQVYLGGGVGSYLCNTSHVYRLYCVAK